MTEINAGEHGTRTLLIATRNAHKVAEIRAILGKNFRYLTLKELPGAPEVVEDAATFAGNATKKAVELARWVSGLTESPKVDFVLADDSGLEVDALKGAPGVHSARFAALDSDRNASDRDNRLKLLRLMQDVSEKKRAARFRCVIALTPVVVAHKLGASPVCYADEFEIQTQLAEGKCEGRILFEEKGSGGFGYDSLFVPEGYEQTLAELPEEEKNRISHRARALAALLRRPNVGVDSD
jgi:XTP/dITP diphosphohydrolase